MTCDRFVRQSALRNAAWSAVAASALLITASASAARGQDVIDAAPSPEVVQLQNSFQSVSDHVSRSVVAISASFVPAENDSVLRCAEMNADKLEAQLDRATRTVGTGMIISADGYILTNEHVVCDGQQLWVTTDDQQVYPAIVVGSDPRGDMAVLKIPASGLHPVTFSPVTARRGQWTIAIGNPFGLAEAGHMAMSVGVVSATERSLPRLTSHENRLYTNLIQTTAQINPGSSGGPLFDLEGRVIGVNTAVIMPQKQTNGIGFAMPVTDEFLHAVHELRNGHEIVYGYIGVMVSTPSARERSLAHVPEEAGVCINAVDPMDRAAGVLQPGDIVYSVNGASVGDSDQFIRRIGEAPVEIAMNMKLSRDGSLMKVSIVPRKRNMPSPAIDREAQRIRWHGMLLGPVPTNAPTNETANDATSCVASSQALCGGVMVYDVDSDSVASSLKIVPGQVITTIAGHAVKDVLDVQKLINDIPTEHCTVTALPMISAVAMTEH